MKQKILFLIIAGVLSCPAWLFLQGLNEVAIFGYVTNSSTGQPVSGVLVEAINEADSTQRSSTISDVMGRYQMNLVTDVQSTPGRQPSDFRLEQNYPNPFNPSTVIGFQVPRSSDVRLVIYNTLGQKVKTLVDQTFAPGEYSVVWDATDETGRGLAAGVYFYQLRTEDDFIQTSKMVLLDGSVGAYSSFSPINSFSKNPKNNMAKSTELMVTIRATGARILPKEWRQVMIQTRNFRFDIVVSVTIESVINKDLVVVSEPSAEGKIYVSGLVDAVIDTVVGTEKVTVINHRTGEEVAMRVNYDGSFPQMSLDATVGDSLSVTLFSEGRQVGESEGLSVQAMRPPVVTKTKPTNGDKDIVVDLLIFIHFSEPMDAATINENSLMLTDNTGKMSGSIGFLNDNTVATFQPDQSLQFGNTYTITVTTDVTDLRGMPITSTFTSTFTTGSGAPETRIAFHGGTTEPDGNGSIYTMNSDGSDWQQLTKRNDAIDNSPDYSPDGTRIVFTRQINQPTTILNDIYIMNWDGTYLENLTNTPDFAEWGPSFSPDGQKIAFSTRDARIDDNWDIYVMDLAGSNRVNLTNDISHNYGADWSPDGQHIVFVSFRDGEMDVFVMGSDGSNPINLTANLDGLAWHPSWSPDGTSIAFYATWDDEIYLIDPDGSNLTYLTNGWMWTHSKHEIAWSPDSQKLAFIDVDWDNGLAISIINRDGTDRHRITNWDNWENMFDTPTWSPRNPR